MLRKIVLDLETQRGFGEVGGRNKNHLLKVSVCGIYDYARGVYEIFEERQLPKLFPLLQSADQIIGYNILDFDFAVLKPYLNFDIYRLPALDLLKEIEKVLGHRVSLESVAQGTLGFGKSGKGLDAIAKFREGKIEELKAYCLDDVKITREIYESVLKRGKLRYQDFFDIKEINLEFAEPPRRVGVSHQPILF